MLCAAAWVKFRQKQKMTETEEAAFKKFMLLGTLLTFWGVWASFFTDIWEFLCGRFWWLMFVICA